MLIVKYTGKMIQFKVKIAEQLEHDIWPYSESISYRLDTSYENFRPRINRNVIIPYRGLWIVTDLPLTAVHLFSRSPDLIFEVHITVPCSSQPGGWDSVVDIVTCCSLDRLGFKPSGGKLFHTPSDRLTCPLSLQ
jgi:hypothetical protein